MPDERYDCILIPGGGLFPNGSLPPWTLQRLDHAIRIHRNSRWIGTLSGGTVHKPAPASSKGYPIFESRAAAEYLLSAGIDPGMILTEIASYDTIGNAYFSRQLMAEPLGLQRLLIVTSQFHLPRTKAAFEWVYQLTPLEIDFQLSFQGVDDAGLEDPALEARIKREHLSLEKLQRTRVGISTIKQFSEWLYTEHAAYASDITPDKITDDELRSY